MMRRVVPVGLGIAVLMSHLFPVPTVQAIEPRIVGGAQVPITDAPWQVFVSIRNQELCGGAIVNATTILTAAHCVDQGRTPADVRVTAGISRIGEPGTDRRASAIEIHPAWDRRSYRNDLALITLDAPLPTSDRISAIRLPNPTEPWPSAGTPASVVGWGSSVINGSATEVLQRADVLILTSPDDPVCGAYGSLFDPVTQVCAGLPQGGVDACQGDSGGALVIAMPAGPTIAGVVSTGQECGRAEFPGLYTRVTTYLPWLQQRIQPAGMVPAAPSITLARSPGPGRVRVTWQPPASDGGASITEYIARVGKQTCRTSATVCVFRNVRRGSTVSARVIAVNDAGSSATSAARVRVR